MWQEDWKGVRKGDLRERRVRTSWFVKRSGALGEERISILLRLFEEEEEERSGRGRIY